MGKKLFVGIVAIVFVILGVGILTYNDLIGKYASVEETQASIEVDLQRRADLIPNLVEIVEANAAHETEVFTAITDARTELVNAQNSRDISEEAEANEKLNAALDNLIVIAEAYPELKSSDSYQTLMTELEGCENRIAVSRKDYNAAVKDYNTAIQAFPGRLFAGTMGFTTVEYFTASEGAEEVPSVS